MQIKSKFEQVSCELRFRGLQTVYGSKRFTIFKKFNTKKKIKY